MQLFEDFQKSYIYFTTFLADVCDVKHFVLNSQRNCTQKGDAMVGLKACS